MADFNERSIANHLSNPFSIYVADTGDSQPATPAFYTEPGMTFTPVGEFAESMVYGECSENNAVLMPARNDMQSFSLTANWQIKETVVNIIQLVFGGSKNSAGSTLTFDGTEPAKKAYWAESCFTDNDKAVRWSIPVGKSIEFAELGSGEGFALVPETVKCLIDPADSTTFPTFYVEA